MPEAKEIDFFNLFLSHTVQLLSPHKLEGIYADRVLRKNKLTEDHDSIILTVNSQNATRTDKIQMWPSAKLVPALYKQQNNIAGFEEANLRLRTIHYHQRLYIMEFGVSGIFLIIQPLLHTSPNLYSKDEWHTWISHVPSTQRGFKVIMALNFREFILSFNSADHLASVYWSSENPLAKYPVYSPICSDTNSPSFYQWSLNQQHTGQNAVTASSVQDSYTVWLTQIVTWIRQHPKGDCPIFETIRENTTVWSGFGSYLTNILLAHAGLRPWTSTLDVIKSPSQLARLCEAAFELYWCGHRDNVARLHRALQYNQHTLCASKKEVLDYTSELYVHGVLKTKVTANMYSEFVHVGSSCGVNDIFNISFFKSMYLPGHLGHLITAPTSAITHSPDTQDPVTSLYSKIYSRKITVFVDSSLDLSTHASKSILRIPQSRKADINIKAYRYGKGKRRPPIVWTLYSDINNALWTLLSLQETEERTLEVIKETTKKYAVGPLDFCGVAKVFRHGNGHQIFFATYPSESTPIEHPRIQPIYLYHYKLQHLVQEEIRKQRNHILGQKRWITGIWKSRGRVPGRARIQFPPHSHLGKLLIMRAKVAAVRKKNKVNIREWVRMTADRLIQMQVDSSN